ncbi:MAG: IS3 family transposase [Burkholderiaceae bacterium]|nr:IS3 family transposase [Burkholderiaceae bacterium]
MCERFFLNLKMACIRQGQYAHHGDAQRGIADYYIIYFYNAQRRRSTLGYVSPNEFEQLRTTTFPQTHCPAFFLIRLSEKT